MRESGSRNLNSSRSLTWRILRSLGTLSLIATVFVLLARIWWFFDLFANFRIQLFAVQIVLFAVFLVMRRPLWAIVIGAATLVNGLAVRDYVLPSGEYVADSEQPAEIRVLNANVRSSNPNPAALIEVVTAVEPDVIAVLEFTADVAEALAALGDSHPHQILLPEYSNFGIAVFSRWPLTRIDDFELAGFAAIDARIGSGAQAWHFIAVHAVPPISADMAALRNRQLQQLSEHLATLTAPHIVVGDLNVTAFSPWFRDFIAATDLRDTLRGRGLSFTWPSVFAPLGITIDHVLVSAEFRVIDYFRAGDIGSDHYPVIVDVNRSRIGLD